MQEYIQVVRMSIQAVLRSRQVGLDMSADQLVQLGRQNAAQVRRMIVGRKVGTEQVETDMTGLYPRNPVQRKPGIHFDSLSQLSEPECHQIFIKFSIFRRRGWGADFYISISLLLNSRKIIFGKALII